MRAFFQQLMAHKQLALILTVASAVMFVASLMAVPWLIARAPHDFFTRPQVAATQRSLMRRLLTNMLGAVLVVVGGLMLVLPGQGILTLLVGLGLMDLPKKHALLVWLAKREGVLKALNFFRARAQREPFQAPQ
jgi:UPF0716 family protein affecting phage T7 exclusion